MFSWSGVLADWQQPGGSPTPTEVHLSRIIFPMISRDYRGDDNEKMMIRLINICQGCRRFETSVFFSEKINISTTGGSRVGFFQPDTNHP